MYFEKVLHSARHHERPEKRLMAHPSFLVKGKVALALGIMDHPERERLLNQLLSDKSPYVVSCAQNALKNDFLSSNNQESLDFLIGITSISANIDAVATVRETVARAEKL